MLWISIPGHAVGTITNCCSTGAVVASTASSLSEIYAGGLAGYFRASISMCYSTGPVRQTIASATAQTLTKPARLTWPTLPFLPTTGW